MSGKRNTTCALLRWPAPCTYAQPTSSIPKASRQPACSPSSSTSFPRGRPKAPGNSSVGSLPWSCHQRGPMVGDQSPWAQLVFLVGWVVVMVGAALAFFAALGTVLYLIVRTYENRLARI